MEMNKTQQLEERIKKLEDLLQERTKERDDLLDIDKTTRNKKLVQNERLKAIVKSIKEYIISDNIQLDFLYDLCNAYIDSLDNLRNLENASFGKLGSNGWR